MFYNQNPYSFRPIDNNMLQYPRSIIYPRFNIPVRKAPSINLSKILETTQRGINTINQIVPIYKQVTPIVKQVGNFTKSLGSFFTRNFTNNQRNQPNEPNDNQINTHIKNNDYRNNENPNSPYFK